MRALKFHWFTSSTLVRTAKLQVGSRGQYRNYRRRREDRLTSAMGDNNNATVTWPKIVLFGDSLTQQGFSADGCWASKTADYVIRKCDVINRGFSGYNTRMCKLILPKIVTPSVAKETILVTIFLGANDSVDSHCVAQHVPLDEYRENLREMVQYLKTVGVPPEKVVLIGPPSCDEEKWRKDCILKDREFGKHSKPVKSYAVGCETVAKDTGARHIDMFTEMMKDPDFSSMLNDGLHLSSRGSELLFSLLEPILAQHTQDLPFLYPYWKDIDNSNPQAVLDKY